jgi:periplasmic divalent cation tolerance protein
VHQAHCEPDIIENRHSRPLYYPGAQMTDKIIVLSTCDSEQQAERIARHLVEKRLAACVNISGKIRSIYRWKNAIEDASELLLVIKTRRDLFPKIRAEIAAIHSYEVPELLALPVVDGADSYLAWLDRELAE